MPQLAQSGEKIADFGFEGYKTRLVLLGVNQHIGWFKISKMNQKIIL